MKIPKEYDNTDFDFGFTAETEEELNQAIEKAKEEGRTETLSEFTTAEEVRQEYEQKLLNLETLIMPLLVNLLKTADKEIIRWPNRGPAIQEKIDQLLSITRPEDHATTEN